MTGRAALSCFDDWTLLYVQDDFSKFGLDWFFEMLVLENIGRQRDREKEDLGFIL